MNDRFHSKIILFGEYSMIFDATALMIPFRDCYGVWKTDPSLAAPGALSSNKSIRRFSQYLAADEELGLMFDFPRLDAELNAGLFFDSNVPTGYGLGSSGMLSAAVYQRFALRHVDDFMELKRILGRMESCFHGSSSGIDPLQCYLNQPFKITPQGVALLEEDFIPSDIHVFLADTGIKSNTKPLVQYFKKKRDEADYLLAFQSEYVPCVSACIDQLIAGEKESFFTSLRQLTEGQMRFLRPMITDNAIDLFIEKPNFHFGVKISGSGGGGYVLGFTDDKKKTAEFMNDYNLIWVR
jgi:mevalonate kinase